MIFINQHTSTAVCSSRWTLRRSTRPCRSFSRRIASRPVPLLCPLRRASMARTTARRTRLRHQFRN